MSLDRCTSPSRRAPSPGSATPVTPEVRELSDAPRSPGDVARARALFPGAERSTYADVAARGLIPEATSAAVNRKLAERIDGTFIKEEAFQAIERVRTKFAGLINCSSDEIAYTKNTSDGLNAVATALDWERGDNVVLCPPLEHPANLYPWLHLSDRHGVELRKIADEGGVMPAERMIAAIDARTRVVTTSLVSFAPGFRTDITRLGEVCRGRGVLFIVDAAQAIGVLHIDVEDLPVDALAVSTQKGLCALYGMGLLYVRRRWAEKLSPVYLSRFGVDLGTAHEASGSVQGYQLMPGARRFDVGNYNYVGAVALEPALDILATIGTDAVEQYVTGLAVTLAARLQEAGIPVFGGDQRQRSTHIVTLGRGVGLLHDDTDDRDMSSLYQALKAAGVRLSIRRGMLRLSLHLYNNEDDVNAIVATAAKWRGERAR
jgi:cysteine desulfurase/selenocysteine lyase